VKNRFVFVVILLAVSAGTVLAAPGDWYRPTSYNDVLGVWTAQPSAYDASLTTYASDGSLRVGYGGELQFFYAAPFQSDRVRVSCDFGYGAVDSVLIRVHSAGAWVQVYSGAVNDVSYSTVLFAPQTIDAIGFTFHYTAANYYFWLYDISAMQAGVATTPVVQTNAATSVYNASADLHARLTNSGGTPCQIRFEYGLTLAYGQTTPWVDGFGTGDLADTPIGGLTNNTLYHFRADVQQSAAGPVYPGGDLTFNTASVPDDGTAGLVTPIGASDGTGTWQNMDNARDDDDATYATCYHAINAAAWSPYLYLNLPPLWSNGVRLVAPSTTLQDQISVDISTNSGATWTNIYSGVINGVLNVAFGAALVNQARIMVHTTSTNSGFYFQFDEFDLQAYTTPPPRAISDLTALQGATPGTINLTWTAPGDYGNKAGTSAKQYDIRYSIVAANSPALSDAMFNAATSVAPAFGTIPTPPAVKGTPEMMALTGLTQGTTYYFAMKARNEIPLWSSLSNGATNWAQIAVRGVTITELTYAFGSVPVATSSASITAVHVTNSGTIPTTYTFSAATTTVGSPWTLGAAAPGADVVVVSAAFHGLQPTVAQFGPEDVMTGVAKACTVTVYSVDGSQTGVSVPVAGARLLWFKMAMPTTSSTVAPQNVTVTVTAGP